MTPEESTEELSDFELTQRLRAARGQAPLPDPDSLEAKLREGADAMLEDHRIRGIDYSRVLIDDPIGAPSRFEWKAPPDDFAFKVRAMPDPLKKVIGYSSGTIKIGDGPTVDLRDLDVTVPGTTTDLRFDNTCGSTADDNAIALAGGTTTGRLKAWTSEE
jgi:hypothetical protein